MTNTSKTRKRCPACGSSNPADAWECEMCGTSFSDVKPPKSVQKADAGPRAATTATGAQNKPPQTKSVPPRTPAPAAQSAKAQAKPAGSKKPNTTETAATAASAKAATESFNTPIKNAGSMKKPRPLYASKPRFGLGSLAALVFIAAFAIAAIVFGLNAMSGNSPAAAPLQPAAVTLEVTITALPLPTAAAALQEASPTQAQVVAPTEAPIEVPAVVPTEAPASTATADPAATIAPTTAAPPPPTTRATATVAASPTPAATATAAATTAPPGSGETVTYTVKGGDTCGAISRQFGVTVAQIIEQNKLDSRCFLNVGKVLTITK